MAENDQILKIIINTEGDAAGLEKTKKGLEDLQGAASKAGAAASSLGSALGVAIPVTAVGAAAALAYIMVEVSEGIRKTALEQLKFTEEINRSVLAWAEMSKFVRSLADEI